MGIFEILRDRFTKGPQLPPQKAQCPYCKSDLTLDMKQCPKCGRPISQLFRLLCPKCREPVEPDAKACRKCGTSFLPPERTTYTCPICEYRADYYMLSCPACGTKFM